MMNRVDVLASRTILKVADLARSRGFYRDVLGLATFREFGDPDDPSVVFFLGSGLLEVSDGGHLPDGATTLWLQVRDLAEEHARLRAAGVRIDRPPSRMPWGLDEMWLADPDGNALVLVEIPADHPLRRDQRPAG